MKVEPEIVHHPKFLRLKRQVGDVAMEALVRIWGHCEQACRGEYWRHATGEYVEVVAQWAGEPGKLFTALRECRFIEQDKRGIRVHDWAHHNWRRVTNWKLGARGGRPKGSQCKATANPVVKPVETAGATPLTELTELNDTLSPSAPPCVEVEAPGWEEWWAYCQQIGLPEWKARREFDNQQRFNWTKAGNWQRHAVFIRSLWEQDGRPMSPPGRNRSESAQKAGETHFQKVERARALEKVLETHPANPRGAYSGEPTAEEARDFEQKERQLRELRRELAEKPVTTVTNVTIAEK